MGRQTAAKNGFSSPDTLPKNANAKNSTPNFVVSQSSASNATNTNPNQSFISELKSEFPDFSFQFGSRFKFKPPKTIFIGPPQPNFALLALHELGHALSGHKNYNTHIKRLKMESEAWQVAKTLIQNHPKWQKEYGIHWDESAEEFAESELDSYRDWLHSKSLCKNCGLTMYQTEDGKYYCPACD